MVGLRLLSRWPASYRWKNGESYFGPIFPRFSRTRTKGDPPQNREVLNGVGADGVGVKFPIFPALAVICPLFQDKAQKGEEKGEIPAQKKAKKSAKKRRKRGDSLQPHLHQPP